MSLIFIQKNCSSFKNIQNDILDRPECIIYDNNHINDILDMVDENTKELIFIYDTNNVSTVPFFTQNIGEYFYFSNDIIKLFQKVKSSSGSLIVNLIANHLNDNYFNNEVGLISHNMGIKIDTKSELSKVLSELPPYENTITNLRDVIDITSLISDAINKVLTESKKAQDYNKKKKGITLDKLPAKYFKVSKNNNGGYNCKLLTNIDLKVLGGTNSNTYINLKNNDIFDGNNFQITVSWENLGIFGSSGNSNLKSPIIKNLNVINKKNIGSKITSSYGGGIMMSVQKYFIIDNCTVKGNINYNGGGICGGFCGINGNIKITNCKINGNIDNINYTTTENYSSGICAIGSGYNGNIILDNCIINGNIGKINKLNTKNIGSGGILGDYCGINSKIRISNCTINGNIGNASSGIIGQFSAINANCEINNCIINGTVGYLAGGIGGAANFNNTINNQDKICTINNCHINGNILSGGYGICGVLSGINGNITIDNCSVSGNIDNIAGGICNSSGYNGSITIKNSFVNGNIGTLSAGIINLLPQNTELYGKLSQYTIENCYLKGEIGMYSGGIINVPIFTNCTINNCYSTGLINEGAGGICGVYTGYNGGTEYGNCTISNCYSTGDISGNYAGGICGDSRNNINLSITDANFNINDLWTNTPFVNKSSLVIDNCYSTGKILYPNKLSGGIIGNCLDKCAINNSYSTSTNLTNSINNKNTSLSVFNSYCTGKIANKLDTTSKVYYNSKTASTTIPTLNLTPITNQLDTTNQVDNIGQVQIGSLAVTPSKWDTINTWKVPSVSTTDNDTYPTLKNNL